jgi:hypothetical protein
MGTVLTGLSAGLLKLFVTGTSALAGHTPYT